VDSPSHFTFRMGNSYLQLFPTTGSGLYFSPHSGFPHRLLFERALTFFFPGDPLPFWRLSLFSHFIQPPPSPALLFPFSKVWLDLTTFSLVCGFCSFASTQGNPPPPPRTLKVAARVSRKRFSHSFPCRHPSPLRTSVFVYRYARRNIPPRCKRLWL